MKIKLSELRKLINEEISGRLIKRDRRDFEERNAKNVLNTIDRSPTPAARFDRPIIKKASSPTKKISLEYEIPNIDIDFTVSKDTHFVDFPLKLVISLNDHKSSKQNILKSVEEILNLDYKILKYNLLFEINNCILQDFKSYINQELMIHEYENDREDTEITMYFSDTKSLKNVLKHVYSVSQKGLINY